MDWQLYLRLEPSKTLRTYLFLLLVLCSCAIALCGLNGWIKLALAIVVATAFWRHERSLRTPFIVGVRVAGSEWQVETATGFQPASLQANPVVTYSITVLHFECANGIHQSVVVLPDSSEAEKLRQLRLLLLNSPDPASSESFCTHPE